MSAPRRVIDRDGAAARPLTLAIDAATYVGTVAVLDGRTVLAERAVAMRGEHEERLMPAVADALHGAGATVADLAEVLCGAGPGSFTSLRIAGAIAKGLAAGRGVPLRALSSLQLVAAGAEAPLAAGRYLAVLDAMRGEWFGAAVVVHDDGTVSGEAGWTLFAAGDLEARRARGERVIGPAPLGDLRPHARGAARVVADAGIVDLDAWEPDYGRKAEAQVRWEAAHGRPLASG